ncbi:MAG: hypothetical protein ACUVWP_03075 [bacterium]
MEECHFQLIFNGKVMIFNEKISVLHLLNKIGVSYEDVLVIDVRNNRLLTPDNRVNCDDVIEIRTVYSKG